MPAVTCRGVIHGGSRGAQLLHIHSLSIGTQRHPVERDPGGFISVLPTSELVLPNSSPRVGRRAQSGGRSTGSQETTVPYDCDAGWARWERSLGVGNGGVKRCEGFLAHR